MWSYSVGFYGVWLAYLGRRTGLLERLAKKPMSVEQLATSTGLYLPAVRSWCSAAISYRLLVKHNDKLHLPAGMASILMRRDHREYLGGLFSYLALRSLQYGASDDLFKHGNTRKLKSSIEAIEEATHWDHYAFLAAIRRNRKMNLLLSQGCKFLDVGCGSGTLIAKLHHEYPHSSFVGVDISQEAVSKAANIGNKKAVTILKMAAETIEFKDQFDIIYLGESLYATKDKQRVVNNCCRALKSGGTVAIVEGLLPQTKIHSDENKLIMGMQMDFALQGHKFMTKKEVVALLKKAGFTSIRIEPLGGSVYLVRASKR